MAQAKQKMKASFTNILAAHDVKLGDKVEVTQIKSTIGRPQDQRDTVKCIGLKHMHDTVTIALTMDAIGRINKVSHLVELKKAA